MNINDIYVSIVVAVYNRENLIDICLNSLVEQTSDNFEIILVDDQSTDNSLQILYEWQEKYPDIIRVFKNPDKGVAYAKNLGIKKAKGKYITFLDSDDYFEYNTLSWLKSSVAEYYAEYQQWPEMVISPIWKVGKGSISKIGECKSLEKEVLLFDVWYFLHGKLFLKDLFETYGLLPHLSIGEDISWVYPVMSKVEHIAYCDKATYFYELSDNSISNSKDRINIVNDIVEGNNIMLNSVNSEYKEYALRYAARRLMIMMQQCPIHKDILFRQIKEYSKIICDSEFFEKKDNYLYKYCQDISFNEQYIPKRIYLNGFCEEKNDEYDYFREPYEVVVLDENNCNVHELPLIEQAYLEGQFDFVANYFAIKKCYEEGGIYIDSDIAVDNNLDALTINKSFFVYEKYASFSQKIFGGSKGNIVFEKILNTYLCNELYDEKYTSLSERIKTVFIGMYEIMLGSSQIINYKLGYSILPVYFCVYATQKYYGWRFTHYKSLENSLNSVTQIENIYTEELRKSELKVQKYKKQYNEANKLSKKRSTYIAELKKTFEEVREVSKKRSEYIVEVKANFEKTRELSKKRSEYITELKEILQEKDKDYSALAEENRKLKEKLNAVLGSTSWKISKPVRAIGKILKKEGKKK